jgi:transcriptional regulator with XRE-family HTH domain
MPGKGSQIGTLLKQAREEAGLSQAAAAQAVDIDSVTLSRYERARLATPRTTLIALAQLYGKPLSFFGEEALSLGGVPRGTMPAAATNEGIDSSTSEAVPARHARNLPYSVRQYLHDFRGRLLKARVPEEAIDEALDLMRSPQVFSFFVGGTARDFPEADVLANVRTFAEESIIPTLKRRGYKL